MIFQTLEIRKLVRLCLCFNSTKQKKGAKYLTGDKLPIIRNAVSVASYKKSTRLPPGRVGVVVVGDAKTDVFVALSSNSQLSFGLSDVGIFALHLLFESCTWLIIEKSLIFPSDSFELLIRSDCDDGLAELGLDVESLTFFTSVGYFGDEFVDEMVGPNVSLPEIAIASPLLFTRPVFVSLTSKAWKFSGVTSTRLLSNLWLCQLECMSGTSVFVFFRAMPNRQNSDTACLTVSKLICSICAKSDMSMYSSALTKI